MRRFINIEVDDELHFKQKLVELSAEIKYTALFDSNNYYNSNVSSVNYSSYNYLAGFDYISIFSSSLEQLEKEKAELGDWLMGYLSYDLKNDLENLYSVNADELNFPKLLFFQPRIIIRQIDENWELGYNELYDSEDSVKTFISKVEKQPLKDIKNTKISFASRVNKEKYLQSVEAILNHIHKGDVYELNYCIEFYKEKANIDPYSTYIKLINISPTPFSCFVKFKDKFIISASPERYLKKVADKIICQPIKGTAPRSLNNKEDKRNKTELATSIKERSENIMIADLVRNDLSRVAEMGSVIVEELCGIYAFQQVFQMITTVTAKLDKGKSDIDSIKTSFPMGSMTGAPKIRAMKLIEKYEDSKRGVYSGAVGYFEPNGNFDFNVIIRSLLYNEVNKYLSFMVGSAITEKSIPEQEYSECLLKANAIFKLFNQKDI